MKQCNNAIIFKKNDPCEVRIKVAVLKLWYSFYMGFATIQEAVQTDTRNT